MNTQKKLELIWRLVGEILEENKTIDPEGFKPPDPSAYYQGIEEDMKAPLKEIKNKHDLEGE